MDTASDDTSFRSLFGLLLLFVCLSLGYNYVQPIFEPPDELAHFRYGQWLSQEKRLPEIYADEASARHEVGQPPLYYVLIAQIIGAFETSDWESVAPANPHYRTQANSVNVYVHGNSAETFPYAGTARAVHLARTLNTLVGVMTIIGCFGLARLLVPKRALLATALVALNPQFISANSTLTNDALVTAFCALALWLLIALMRLERAGTPHAVAIGVLWGFAALSKMSGVTFGGVVLLGLGLVAIQSGRWAQFSGRAFTLGTSALVVAGWWFWRNWQLYDDPLAWDALLYANRTLVREEAIGVTDILSRMGQVFLSFWASFGNRLPVPSLFNYFVIALTACAFFGLVRSAIKWLRSGNGKYGRAIEIVVLLVWILGSFVSFLRWMALVEKTAQGRLLLPIVTAVAVLLTIGLSNIDVRGWLHRIFVAGLGVWAVALPLLVVIPAYALPDAVSAETIPTKQARRYGTQIKLHGFDLVTQSLAHSDRLVINLYWEALEDLEASYVISLHAVDSGGNVVASYDGIPFRALFPTQIWPVGHIFRDNYVLPPLSEDAMVGSALLYVNVRPDVDGDAGQALPIFVDGVELVDAWRLATFKIAVPEREVDLVNPVDYTFENLGKLTGYCFTDVPVVGEPVDVQLVWQVLDSAEIDYTVFVHLLDESGQTLLAQGDSPPMNNRYPTSIWAEDETIVDVHQMNWDAEAAGDMQLSLGLYDPITGQRLSVVDAGGAPLANDAVVLELPTGESPERVQLCK